MFRYGPESLGGNGYLKEKIDKIVDETENEDERNKEIVKLCRRMNDMLIDLPGQVPMYAYEHSPQRVRRPRTIIGFVFLLMSSHQSATSLCTRS